jgi:hypothetical protein
MNHPEMARQPDSIIEMACVLQISNQYDDVDGDDTSAYGQALAEFLELCQRWTGRETEAYGPLTNHTYSLSLLQ